MQKTEENLYALQSRIPALGVAISIIKSDGTVITETTGYSNPQTQLPVTPDTRFLCASISKLFTGLSVLILFERGQLDLDKDINEYIEIKVYHPNGLPITARKLLEHCSGFGDDESGLNRWRSIDLSAFSLTLKQHVSAHIAKNQKYLPTNPIYHYSNAGFTLLGYIIEEISKQSFEQFIQENIFKPLQIQTACWFIPTDNIENLAVPVNILGEVLSHYCVAEYPACQLRISINDLTRFLKMFTHFNDPEQPKVISKQTLQFMCPSDFRHGLAWWGIDAIYSDKTDVWAHGGYMDGVRTHIYYYPQSNSGFIILTNGEESYYDIVKYCRKKMLQ
jgi:CubicO group peptidase (beta-lactamase class C family)